MQLCNIFNDTAYWASQRKSWYITANLQLSLQSMQKKIIFLDKLKLWLWRKNEVCWLRKMVNSDATWGLWVSRWAQKTPAWPVFSGCGHPSALSTETSASHWPPRGPVTTEIMYECRWTLKSLIWRSLYDLFWLVKLQCDVQDYYVMHFRERFLYTFFPTINRNV